MALVSKIQNEMLAALQTKLDTYMVHNWLVFVHIDTPNIEMHHAFCPDTASVNQYELMLSYGHFELLIHLADVTKFDICLETENSYYVVADQTEIYFDFQHE